MSKPIYIICTYFFPTPESWRGAFCYDFARAVARTGRYDVRVFLPGKGGDYDYHDLRVYRYETKGLPYGLFPWFGGRWGARAFLRKAAAVGIDWRQVAVCHSHEIDLIRNSVEAKKRNPSLRILHHFHAMGHPFHVALPRLGVVPGYADLVYRYYRKLLGQVDVPTFVSARQRDMMGRWYPHGFLGEAEDLRRRLLFGRWTKPISLKSPKVLYNGIDSGVFFKAKVDGERRNRSDSFVIGCVANFWVSKDQMTLLRAVRRLKGEIAGLKVRFVGSGPTLAACRDYVRREGLGDVVEFLTEMDHLKLPDFYRSLDLFVLPSWAEGFCCSYMESWGCGTPFMGCRGVSVEEALKREDWDAWLVPPQDDAALADRIARFHRERPEQKLSQSFDIDDLVGAYLEKAKGQGQGEGGGKC